MLASSSPTSPSTLFPFPRTFSTTNALMNWPSRFDFDEFMGTFQNLREGDGVTKPSTTSKKRKNNMIYIFL